MSAIASSTIRIAVLECLNFPENVLKEGTFANVFDDWLTKSAEAYNSKRISPKQIKISIIGFDVVAGKYPNNVGQEFDAIIVTGSMEAAYDKDKMPWIQKLDEYVRDVFKNHQHVRIFGGCFGHQLVAQALLHGQGVKVEKSPKGWEVGVQQVTLDPQFKTYFPMLKDIDSMSCQFMHSDHVVIPDSVALKSDYVMVGESELCQRQGLLLPGRVLTFQGHPEFNKNITVPTIQNLEKKKVFNQQEANNHLQSAKKEDDAILHAEVLIHFFASQ